ncbi:MAG: hypothetical protein M1837_003157 [Sclerophora amabilis]|nr:MAG: hypothetical protein M1837_003157 [Sclerophora amabilis]
MRPMPLSMPMPSLSLSAAALPFAVCLISFLAYTPQYYLFRPAAAAGGGLAPAPLSGRETLTFNALVACVFVGYFRAYFTAAGLPSAFSTSVTSSPTSADAQAGGDGQGGRDEDLRRGDTNGGRLKDPESSSHADAQAGRDGQRGRDEALRRGDTTGRRLKDAVRDDGRAAERGTRWPRKWCKKCARIKPPRAHHCKECKTYVFFCTFGRSPVGTSPQVALTW